MPAEDDDDMMPAYSNTATIVPDKNVSQGGEASKMVEEMPLS